MRIWLFFLVLACSLQFLHSEDPTSQPSPGPSGQPSSSPTAQPSKSPHSKPSSQPTSSPTGQPSKSPHSKPTSQPSISPTAQPSRSPISKPTSQPSGSPTQSPSERPSSQPTGSPTEQPSGSPTSQPSSSPVSRPTSQPSVAPSAQPIMHPTSKPSAQPSVHPSTMPSSQPSGSPSTSPTIQPTAQPSLQPAMRPTSRPSTQPSSSPTKKPSVQPSAQPSKHPTSQPSTQPSKQPVEHPTTSPSAQPTSQPSFRPSSQPTTQPSAQPNESPTSRPSVQPTVQPSSMPSVQPSSQPSAQPVEGPTSKPTGQPSVQPSFKPTMQPSTQPSAQPIEGPTSKPTGQPTVQPSMQPSSQPNALPSSVPSGQPSMQPSTQPSAAPTGEPTAQPSAEPTAQPSTFPSDHPSLQPTRQPTSIPTSQPSSMPSGHPSTQPSMQPSTQPSAAPTGDPTSQPSGAPSTQPTSFPSENPSSVPSTQPTVRPSSQPSLQPSTQPSAAPTGDPTGQPTRAPSAQPSAQPSSVPSAQPSTFPSDMPSTEPSTQPSGQPSVQPTTQPSRQPFSHPTSKPSGQPSARPSTLPSSQPSSYPSGQPSSAPSSQPSESPTTQPTGEPSAQPSTQPTGAPTCEPTSQPSSLPSGQPSSAPTCQPTSQPSSVPSSQPSSFPTSLPTTQPSSQPSSQPVGVPTSQPSSAPTTVVSTRHYACNSNSVCEGQTPTSCSYFTPSIVLTCVDEATPCLINTGSFSLGPDTTMVIHGGCELVVNATKTITVYSNSTLKSAAISISSRGDMNLYGRITTTGLGPLGGPGAPPAKYAGRGGTYGGSGGNANCNLDYYSNFNHQIGSINVQSDVTSVSSPNHNATYGSGGGLPNAGRGGGRIILKSIGTVFVQSGGLLDAMGSPANHTELGAGSGGSILITAASVVQQGIISVVGGPSQSTSADAGASGGGGRVMISISSGTIESIITTAIYYRAGDVALSTANAPCLRGASGTLFVQLRSTSSGSALSGVVQVSNNDANTFAATLLHVLPSKTTGVWVVQGGVVSTNTTIVLKQLSSCTLEALGTPSCTAIRFVNSELVTLRNTTEVRRPYTSTIIADEVRFIGSHVAGVRFTEYSVNIGARVFELSVNSTVSYSSELRIVATYTADVHGAVTQKPHAVNPTTGKVIYTPISLMHVNVGGNLTIGNVSASNLIFDAGRVVIPPNSLISKTADTIVSSCVMNITQTDFECYDYEYTEKLRYNNTYVMIGNHSIIVSANSLMEASQILLCAPDINILEGAYISTSFRGCSANHGPGAGGIQSTDSVASPYGGGGGGYGGAGGFGYNIHNSGVAYYSKRNLSSGSGGGCLGCEDTFFASGGGGLINIVANNSLVMNGNLSANGGAGTGGSGGGAGGTVAVDAFKMSGEGRISAFGGSGGDGTTPGGGGGGGVVALFNYLNSFTDYTFTGFVDVNGGSQGSFPQDTADVSYESSTDGYPDISPARNKSTNPRQLRSSAAPMTYWAPQSGPSQATSGEKGKTFLPTCKPGYGNDAVTGAVCEPCPTGTYGPGYTSDPCIECSNAPLHSHYITPEWENYDCPYACDSGYATEHCYSPIQNFVYNVMGVPAFAGMCVGIFLILILPLGYTRLKRRYGWFTYFDTKKQKRRDMFGIDFFARSPADDYDMDTSGGKGEVAIKMQKFTTENPVLRSASADTNQIVRDSDLSSSIRSLRNNLFAERRREHRMNDQDLVFHAYRINLFGANHPLRSKGGPWKFPSNRPACLRPMLRRTEFRDLAAKINKLTEWHFFSFEMLAFYLVGIIAAPLAASLMKQFRKRRGEALLKIIAHYDYSCFRCPKQRLSQNSLRIGISPDYTLAYVDFLFDEEHFRTRVKPLCPVGQVKLPATFKVAGLGTYCSPYFIDTNDLILQAVPQTDIPSSFINDAWIRFVVELNTILRTVQSDSVHLGVYKLMKFLSKEEHHASLGGLVVEFCTFPNNEKQYPSELRHRERESAVETSPSDQFGEEAVAGAGAPGERARSPSETQARVDRFSLDSFGFATGGRKSNDGGNWFANFLDVSTPWGKSNGPAAAKGKGPVELEMRSSSFKGPSEKESTSSIITRESASPAGANASAPAGSRSTTGSGFVGIYRYFEGIFNYIADNIAKFLASGYKLEDPAGKTLTFHEMCNAIQEGNLNMGIIVTHSKIAADNYVVQDDDYDSEDEEFYEEDVPRTPPKRLETLRESDEDSDSGVISDESGEASEAESISNTSPLRTISTATDMSVSLHKVYGDKADEMQKFYNIMMSADAQVLQAASTPEAVSNRKRASIPTVPSGDGMGADQRKSNRVSPPQSQRSDRRTPESSGRFVRSTSNSALAGENLGRRPPTPSKELTSTTDRRASKKAPSPAVFDSNTRTKPASRGPTPEMEDYDMAVDTSGYAYPGRQTYGEFDFSDALEMEPAAAEAARLDKLGSEDRRTPASEGFEGFLTPPIQGSSSQDQSGFKHSDEESPPSKKQSPIGKASVEPQLTSFRHSEDSDGSAEPAANATQAARPFRRSTGSSGSDADDVAPPVTSTKAAPFRRSTSSGSEVDDAAAAAAAKAAPRRSTGSSGSGSGEDAPAAPLESKPYTGFRYSVGSGSDEGDAEIEAVSPSVPKPETSLADKNSSLTGAKSGSDTEAPTPAPAQPAARRASEMASGFRHSNDSHPSEDSSEPSTMPQRTLSSTDDERPFATKSSPSKASPKQSVKEEYTEFRPADRGRKTTSSAAGFEDAMRFSEFRHSNVYDDRVSDFGYDEGVVSVQQSIIRHRDSELEEDQAFQPSVSQYSFAMSRNQSADSAVQEGSVLARSVRAPTVRAASTDSQRSRIKSTTKKSRRPNSTRKTQKDLSRVNLAPSAHQQEFNAWRLVKDATVPVSGEPVTDIPTNNSLAKLTLGGGELHGASPMHGRESMTVDRSSMITSDDRAVDDLYVAEEGGMGGLELSNPMRSAVRPRSVNPVNVSDRSQLASWSKEKSRGQFDTRNSDVDSDATPTAKVRPRSVDMSGRPRSVDMGGFVFDGTDSRPSEAITVPTEGNQLSDQASNTIKQGFKALYSSRVLLLFLSRYMFGGNVYPIGASYVRRILELIIFILSITDMVLGSMICLQFYCVSSDTTSCQDHTFMLLILLMFPFAIIITPLLGVTAVMLGPTATLSRIYAMWCRLAGVNNLIMLAVYVDYFSYFGNMAISTYPLIAYTCSRAIQCLLVDQYIAHIEKLRYTRGWDGLNTSLFKTQDNKTFIS